MGLWNKHHANAAVTEDMPGTDEYNVALPMGCGESKHVVERMLQNAAHDRGVRVRILRLGQVAGPVRRDCVWNPAEWFPGLIKTSKSLNVYPEDLGNVPHVSWFPVDMLAKQLSRL